MTAAHPIPAAALANHIAILGKTGSGKTYSAKGVVESILSEGGRVCVIDPTGAWHGLRSSATGKSAGFPVAIFGGAHADLPLAGAHGEALAEIIGASSTPAILDTSLMRVGERTRFFADFADALVRKNKGPLHLVIDEAHLFAPQGKVSDPQSGAMLHAANNLVSLGRSRGLRIIMISQRPAKLHKDSLTQVETLVAMRLIAPQDRRAVEDWIKDNADEKQGREIIASLATLKTGQGWVWAPELGVLERVAFPKIKTFDTSKAPEEGGDGKGPVLAPIDRDAIEQRLKTVAADALANDPKALKAKVAELTRELQRAQQNIPQNIPAADPEAEQRAYEQGYLAGMKRGWQEGHESAWVVVKNTAIEHMERRYEIAPEMGPNWPPKMPRPSVGRRPAASNGGVPDTKRLRHHRQSHNEMKWAAGDGSLSGPQQRLVDAIAWWNALGHPRPTRAQIAFVAGYKPNTGTFNTYLGALSTSGLIEYPERGCVALTQAGAALARAPSARPDQQELLERVNGVLSGPQAKLLAALVDSYPEPISRDRLAEAAGYQPNTGTFNTYLGSLSTLEIVEYPQRGQVQAAQWLFP